MGMKSSDTAVIYLEDVRVPAVNVIGDPGMGFSYQMIQVRFWPRAIPLQSFIYVKLPGLTLGLTQGYKLSQTDQVVIKW